MRRSRLHYFLAGCVVVGLGLSSRRFEAELPELLGLYAGDTLWALLVFTGIGFLAPGWTTLQVARVSLVFSYGIEFSQLYHAPWIDALRGTRLGGLVLGYGFLWSDMLCYTLGVLIGVILETAATGPRRARRERELGTRPRD